MKVRFFTFIVLLVFISIVPAGTARAGQRGLVGKGVKIGFGYAGLRGYDTYDWEPRVTFAAGAFADVRVMSFLAFQPELIYNCKGAEITLGGELTEYGYRESRIKIKLQYLELALLVKLLPSTPKDIEVFQFVPKIVLGPVFGKNISAERVEYGPAEDYDNVVNDNEFGLIIGGGLDNYIGGGCYITFDFRFQYSFTKAVEKTGTGLYNKQFIFLLGFSF